MLSLHLQSSLCDPFGKPTQLEQKRFVVATQPIVGLPAYPSSPESVGMLAVNGHT